MSDVCSDAWWAVNEQQDAVTLAGISSARLATEFAAPLVKFDCPALNTGNKIRNKDGLIK